MMRCMSDAWDESAWNQCVAAGCAQVTVELVSTMQATVESLAR